MIKTLDSVIIAISQVALEKLVGNSMQKLFPFLVKEMEAVEEI